MAVYHLACRLIADPTKPNPPARVAKWQQACALESCERMVWKGDMISCTRDNENGHRKGAEPKSQRPTEAPPLLLATAPDEDPPTHRDPFPMTAPASAPVVAYVPRETLECARRELDRTRRALDEARAELQDARNVIAAMRAVLAGAK